MSARSRVVEWERTHEERVVSIRLPGGILTRRTAVELVDVLAGHAEDRSVRCVLVSAAGEDFCTGWDPDADPADLAVDPASAIAAQRVPVVVSIQGRCTGVGLEIALAADIRIAHDESSFGLPLLSDAPLPCWGGSQRLARCVRPSVAVGMMMLGTELGAAEAARAGLAHVVTTSSADATEEVVRTLLANGPLALQFAKEAVHRGAELPLRDGLRLEGDLNHQLAVTDDRAEGLRAFFEKRPPDFAGR